MSPEEEQAAYRLAQAAEWGTYVAAVPIFIDGSRAFNAGDPVPVTHVNLLSLQEQVSKVPDPPKTTKAAIKAEAEKDAV